MDEPRNEIDGATGEEQEKRENPFFPESRTISEEEFDSIPRGDATFGFRITSDEGSFVAQLKIRGNQTRIAVELGFDAREKLDPENLELFNVKNEGRRLEYPKTNAEEEVLSEKQDEKEYYIDGLKPRKSESDLGSIERIGAEQVARLIEGIDGSELIFYTGAGVSMGGEKPVWGMSQLWEELGLKGDGSGFLRVFSNPKDFPPSELLARADEFRKQLFEDISTPAHVAISEIVKLKEQSVVFTENVDLKHEASRVSVIHTDSNPDSFTKVKLRTDKAKILITAGLSKDDRAIIQYFKQHNEELRIIAFALSEDTVPEYLDEKDVVVLGDVQETLPLVVEKIKGITS